MQTTPQKSLITLRLRTDLGRSVEVTTATQLVATQMSIRSCRLFAETGAFNIIFVA